MNDYNRFEDPKHIKWAKDVKKRDRFSCRVCNIKNVYLNSHHLNSFDIFVSQRFNIDNGITLCQVHHDDFHQIYGHGKNTVYQFLEFLEIINIIKIITKEDYDKKTRRYRPRI